MQPTWEELSRLSDREVLVQLRMSMAVLEERTKNLPALDSRLEQVENDNRWLKKLVFTVAPLGPIAGGVTAWMSRMVG